MKDDTKDLLACGFGLMSGLGAISFMRRVNKFVRPTSHNIFIDTCIFGTEVTSGIVVFAAGLLVAEAIFKNVKKAVDAFKKAKEDVEVSEDVDDGIHFTKEEETDTTEEVEPVKDSEPVEVSGSDSDVVKEMAKKFVDEMFKEADKGSEELDE